MSIVRLSQAVSRLDVEVFLPPPADCFDFSSFWERGKHFFKLID